MPWPNWLGEYYESNPGPAKRPQTSPVLQRLAAIARCCIVLPISELDGEHSVSMPSVGELKKTSIVGSWLVTLRLIESSGIAVGGDHSVLGSETAKSLSGQDSWSAYLDRRALGDWLRVRVRQPGDRFQPLGMEGKKKLQDFFTDDKVPRGWRDRVPVLVAEQGIAWVVGYRIAHWARVVASESGTGTH